MGEELARMLELEVLGLWLGEPLPPRAAAWIVRTTEDERVQNNMVALLAEGARTIRSWQRNPRPVEQSGYGR